MTAMDGLNTGPPSDNGAGPVGGPDENSRAEASRRASIPEITLVIDDRLDALERTLGTVRRRGMKLEVSSLVRRQDHLVLVFRAAPDAMVPNRWIAELEALVDVKKVDVTGLPTSGG